MFNRLMPNERRVCKYFKETSPGFTSIVISATGSILYDLFIALNIVSSCRMDSREGVPPPI